MGAQGNLYFQVATLAFHGSLMVVLIGAKMKFVKNPLILATFGLTLFSFFITLIVHICMRYESVRKKVQPLVFAIIFGFSALFDASACITAYIAMHDDKLISSATYLTTFIFDFKLLMVYLTIFFFPTGQVLLTKSQYKRLEESASRVQTKGGQSSEPAPGQTTAAATDEEEDSERQKGSKKRAKGGADKEKENNDESPEVERSDNARAAAGTGTDVVERAPTRGGGSYACPDTDESPAKEESEPRTPRMQYLSLMLQDNLGDSPTTTTTTTTKDPSSPNSKHSLYCIQV